MSHSRTLTIYSRDCIISKTPVSLWRTSCTRTHEREREREREMLNLGLAFGSETRKPLVRWEYSETTAMQSSHVAKGPSTRGKNAHRLCWSGIGGSGKGNLKITRQERWERRKNSHNTWAHPPNISFECIFRVTDMCLWFNDLYCNFDIFSDGIHLNVSQDENEQVVLSFFNSSVILVKGH